MDLGKVYCLCYLFKNFELNKQPHNLLMSHVSFPFLNNLHLSMKVFVYQLAKNNRIISSLVLLKYLLIYLMISAGLDIFGTTTVEPLLKSLLNLLTALLLKNRWKSPLLSKVQFITISDCDGQQIWWIRHINFINRGIISPTYY